MQPLQRDQQVALAAIALSFNLVVIHVDVGSDIVISLVARSTTNQWTQELSIKIMYLLG